MVLVFGVVLAAAALGGATFVTAGNGSGTITACVLKNDQSFHLARNGKCGPGETLLSWTSGAAKPSMRYIASGPINIVDNESDLGTVLPLSGVGSAELTPLADLGTTRGGALRQVLPAATTITSVRASLTVTVGTVSTIPISIRLELWRSAQCTGTAAPTGLAAVITPGTTLPTGSIVQAQGTGSAAFEAGDCAFTVVSMTANTEHVMTGDIAVSYAE